MYVRMHMQLHFLHKVQFSVTLPSQPSLTLGVHGPGGYGSRFVYVCVCVCVYVCVYVCVCLSVCYNIFGDIVHLCVTTTIAISSAQYVPVFYKHVFFV